MQCDTRLKYPPTAGRSFGFLSFRFVSDFDIEISNLAPDMIIFITIFYKHRAATGCTVELDRAADGVKLPS